MIQNRRMRPPNHAVGVSLNVVYGYQGLPPSPGESFCSRNADEQGSRQPRAIGDCNDVQGFLGAPRRRQGLFDDRIEPLDVGP